MGSATLAPRADAERAGARVPAHWGARWGDLPSARARAGKGSRGPARKGGSGGSTYGGLPPGRPFARFGSGEETRRNGATVKLISSIAVGSGSRSRAGRGLAATDTFTRTVASGWGTADFGGAWTPESETSDFSVTGTTGRVRLAGGGVTRAASSSSGTAVDWDVSAPGHARQGPGRRQRLALPRAPPRRPPTPAATACLRASAPTAPPTQRLARRLQRQPRSDRHAVTVRPSTTAPASRSAAR